VRGRLRDDLVESLARSLPIGTLNCEEGCESECSGQTKDEVLSLSAQDRSHQRVGQEPTEANVQDRLGGELLKLAHVKRLHLYDFPLGKIIILK